MTLELADDTTGADECELTASSALFDEEFAEGGGWGVEPPPPPPLVAEEDDDDNPEVGVCR